MLLIVAQKELLLKFNLKILGKEFFLLKNYLEEIFYFFFK